MYEKKNIQDPFNLILYRFKCVLTLLRPGVEVGGGSRLILKGNATELQGRIGGVTCGREFNELEGGRGGRERWSDEGRQ